jgi:hypothetical protein
MMLIQRFLISTLDTIRLKHAYDPNVRETLSRCLRERSPQSIYDLASVLEASFGTETRIPSSFAPCPASTSVTARLKI